MGYVLVGIREEDVQKETGAKKKYPWTGKRIHIFTLLSALLLIAIFVTSAKRE